MSFPIPAFEAVSIITIQFELTSAMLGTKSGDPKIYEAYIAGDLMKSLDPEALAKLEEELEGIARMRGIDPNDPKNELHGATMRVQLEKALKKGDLATELDKATTGFARSADGCPMIQPYMLKGFFKAAASTLAKVPGTESTKIKAFKKLISDQVFIWPVGGKPKNVREIRLDIPQELRKIDSKTGRYTLDIIERPLRASTPQGERVSLARSEAVPIGTKLVFEVHLLHQQYEAAVIEWCSYGAMQALGQWRNAGNGCVKADVLSINGVEATEKTKIHSIPEMRKDDPKKPKKAKDTDAPDAD